MAELGKPRALLFDLDGTLLDTARDMGTALNQLLADHGRPPKGYQEYRPIASHGAMGMLKLGFADIVEAEAYESLRKGFLDLYHLSLCQHTSLFAGIDKLLEGLADKQLPWGIVTNKPTWLTLPLLEQFPLLQTAGVVVCGDTLARRKPHPDPLWLAAEKLAVKHQAIWYVGDAERDMQAARAASMSGVLAEYGYICPTEQPQHWQVDLRIDHPEALLPRLA
ncbi:HAD family hydrolase [Bowmanella dokdonensis]|uniref:HAD-IA family hydrolase n=1 Tax=Bowmanella dokdonensis TaxID=751969 RepID=A0A939IPZ5_9ALTE|nr:HAD-IA family hydrolase [Bowmanella dokdonensis]MBN7824504.1 HAD-IA family hydrolase [Bowmanella dokdonensis]